MNDQEMMELLNALPARDPSPFLISRIDAAIDARRSAGRRWSAERFRFALVAAFLLFDLVTVAVYWKWESMRSHAQRERSLSQVYAADEDDEGRSE